MLLGREREFEILRNIFERKENGGRIVLIRGEAGIGKTALVEEFISRANCNSLVGRCSPILTPPLHPFREALKSKNLDNLLGIPKNPKILMLYAIHSTGILLSKVEKVDFNIDADIFTSMLTAVEMFVKDSLSGISKGSEYLEELRYGDYNLIMKMGNCITLVAVVEGRGNEFLHRDLESMLQEIEEKYCKILESWDGNMSTVSGMNDILNGLLNSGKYEGNAIEISVQDWNFENVRLGLSRLSKKKRICIFIDDIQWADEGTISLMHYLARSEEDKFLIIGTYRSEEKNEEISELEEAILREGIGDIIDLSSLDRDSVLSLIEKTLKKEISIDVLNYVDSASGRVPLNVIEISKMLLDEGYLVERKRRYYLSENPEKLPTRMESIVMRRLRMIGEEQRDIVEFAAVIGTRVLPGVLSCGLDMRKITLLKVLRSLTKTGIFKKEDDTYSFSHDYVRDAIYRNIDGDIRKEYHAIVAECMQDVDIDDVVKTIAMGEHYYHAGKYQKAFEFLSKALENAFKNYAFKEAIRYGEILLKCSKEIRDEEKIRTTLIKLGELYLQRGEFEKGIKSYEDSLKIEESAEAYIGLGNAFYQIGEYDKAMGHYQKAENISEEDHERLLINIANLEIRRGNMQEAEKKLKLYLEWAKKNGKDLIEAYKTLGVFYSRYGKYKESEKYLSEALKIAKSGENKLEVADIMHNLGVLYMLLGKNEEAIEYALEAINIMESMGEVRRYSKTSNLLGLVYWNSGNKELALKYFTISLKYAKLLGIREDAASPLTNIGMIYYYSKSYEEAKKYLEEAIRILDELGSTLRSLESLLYLASVYVDTENEESKKIMAHAMEITKNSKIESYQIWVSVLNCRIAKDEECLRKIANTINDPLLKAISYQHLWAVNKKKEYKEKAVHYFKTANFMGALEYFS